MTSQIGYLKLLITRSILSGPLDFEIKRVACICCCSKAKWFLLQPKSLATWTEITDQTLHYAYRLCISTLLAQSRQLIRYCIMLAHYVFQLSLPTIKTIDQILHYACPKCIWTLFACNQDSWSGITTHLPIMYLNFVAIRATDQISVLCLPIMYLNFDFYQILHYAWYVCIWTAFRNQGNWSDIRVYMSKS